MHKICAINIRPDDKESLPLIKKIIRILEDTNIRVILPDYNLLHETDLSDYIKNQEQFLSEPDLVISIGGDGTFLHTVRLFPASLPYSELIKAESVSSQNLCRTKL